MSDAPPISVPPQRHRFRIGLRAMFVVVTVFGMLLGWIGYQLDWIRQRQAYLWETANAGKVQFTDRQPNLGLWLFGEEGVDWLVIGPFADNPDPAYAKSLFPEAEIIDPSDQSNGHIP